MRKHATVGNRYLPVSSGRLLGASVRCHWHAVCFLRDRDSCTIPTRACIRRRTLRRMPSIYFRATSIAELQERLHYEDRRIEYSSYESFTRARWRVREKPSSVEAFVSLRIWPPSIWPRYLRSRINASLRRYDCVHESELRHKRRDDVFLDIKINHSHKICSIYISMNILLLSMNIYVIMKRDGVSLENKN